MGFTDWRTDSDNDDEGQDSNIIRTSPRITTQNTQHMDRNVNIVEYAPATVVIDGNDNVVEYRDNPVGSSVAALVQQTGVMNPQPTNNDTDTDTESTDEVVTVTTEHEDVEQV